MKEVKFYFYKIEYVFADRLINTSLREYFKSPFDVRTHLFDINDHKAFLEKKTDNIYSFQKFRRDFNPTIKDENTGATREVDLKESEYFIEESYMYIDFDNHILVYQRNHIGYSVSAFEKYIRKLLENKFKDDFFALKPILSKDGVEKLVHHHIAKSLELKVAAPNVGILKNLGFSEKAIRDLDYDSLESIEIIIKSKKKMGIFNMEKLTSVLGIKKNRDKYEKLKIKGSTSYEGTGDMIDLLDDFYVITEKIQQKPKSKVINQSDIIQKIRTIYEYNIDKILKICDD